MPRHVPVLISEVLENLHLQPGMVVVDCTLGDAGHSEAILAAIGPKGKLVGIDADPEALLRAKQYLHQYEKQIFLVRDNFVHLQKILSDLGLDQADAILMDLGWSSPQFAERGRGFSFLTDEPLDMRYSGSASSSEAAVTAKEILDTERESDLAKIFRQFGEEKFAKQIAAAIVAARKNAPIERTSQLNEIVLSVYRQELHTDKEIPWVGGHHPATLVYQALRIAVNREFEVLHQALPQAVAALKPGGRLAVITFHSLEDRLVKQFFKSQENKSIRLITKKPLVASDAEVRANSRSRSAKLRVVEKL